MSSSFPKLNFPAFQLQMRENKGRKEILDPVRRKYIALTPEEWVRQHIIHFLSEYRSYPLHLLAVEYTLKLNQLAKRCDILAMGKGLKPLMIVEVKASHVRLDQKVLDQAVRYNIQFEAPFVVISNGLRHYVVKIDRKSKAVDMLRDIPDYGEIADFVY